MTLLSSPDVARFVARGFLRLDAVVPDDINRQFLKEMGPETAEEMPLAHYGRLMKESRLPLVAAGTPLSKAYPNTSALSRFFELEDITGAVHSLVGAEPVVDHHFLHITFPPAALGEKSPVSQHWHQDSTIDPRRAFDIQLMYFPHTVTAEMGGTRYLPGSHLRRVSEAAISRYQNIKGQQRVTCEAGTVLVMHSGIWHGGGANISDQHRYMFKIRLCPTGAQSSQWDLRDLPADHLRQRPIFWVGDTREPDHIHTILTEPEPWFEFDTSRLEYINRIKLWRYMLGDESFDADYWLTRLENDY